MRQRVSITADVIAACHLPQWLFAIQSSTLCRFRWSNRLRHYPLLYQNIQDQLPEQDDEEDSAEGGDEGFYLDPQGSEINVVEYEQDYDRGTCEEELGDHERHSSLVLQRQQDRHFYACQAGNPLQDRRDWPEADTLLRGTYYNPVLSG